MSYCPSVEQPLSIGGDALSALEEACVEAAHAGMRAAGVLLGPSGSHLVDDVRAFDYDPASPYLFAEALVDRSWGDGVELKAVFRSVVGDPATITAALGDAELEASALSVVGRETAGLLVWVAAVELLPAGPRMGEHRCYLGLNGGLHVMPFSVE